MGDFKIFKVKDEGLKYYLNKFVVFKYLGIKIGSLVMFVRNLSDI